VQSFGDCINACELQELRSNGPYFTWTNKTIWTRIYRVFVNAFCFNPFDFYQATYMRNSLSYHTALVIDFPWCPQPKHTFRFCDMWVRDPSFFPLVEAIKSKLSYKDPTARLKHFLKATKAAPQKLN